MYRLEICKAGRTVEYRYYYSCKYNNGKYEGKRQKKDKPTKEAQEKINYLNCQRTLTRIMNANFWKDDYYITLDYRKELRPKDKEAMRKDAAQFLKALRAAYQKAGIPLKYVYVAERGKRGALHHHMVINGGVDLKVLKELWSKGWITIKPLSDTGQYRRLAEYFVKWSHEAMKNDDERIHGKHWNSSRNLIHPVPQHKIVTNRKGFQAKAREKKGYYVDKDSIQQGVHAITGYPFFYYTLIKT